MTKVYWKWAIKHINSKFRIGVQAIIDIQCFSVSAMGKWASFTNFWRATGQSNLADRIEGCSTGQSAVVYEYENQAFVAASVCIQVWLSRGPPGFASCSGYCAGLINPHKVDVKLKARRDVFKETRHVKQLILNTENTKTLTVINRTNSRQQANKKDVKPIL